MAWWIRPDIQPSFKDDKDDKIRHPKQWYFGVRGELTFEQLRNFWRKVRSKLGHRRPYRTLREQDPQSSEESRAGDGEEIQRGKDRHL